MRKVIIALMLLAPLLIFGQGVTTGSFSGKVTDVDGNPVVGADIILVHVPTGTRYVTLTRTDGAFNVPSVRVGGPYTMTANFEGFREEKYENLVVKLGETKVINVKLQLATVNAGEVIVTASNPIINPYRTGASQNVAQDAIESMPTLSRSLADFTRLSPQFVSDVEVSGTFSAGGRNNRYNNIQIDGAVNNDVFGLSDNGTPGGQTETTPISLDVVQEFQIVLAPYDVRHGMFTGGGVNVITKSGTNDFHGSAYFFGRNESFVGNGPSDYEFGKFTDSTFGATFGGALVKDKVFFFVSAESTKYESPADYFVDGSGSSSDLGGLDEAQAVYDKLKGYGYDPGSFGDISNENNSMKIFARLDWNINDSNRLTLRHNFVDADKSTFTRTTWGLTFSNAGPLYQNKTNSTVLQLNSTLSNTMANELTLGYNVVRDNPTYQGDAFPYVQIDTETGYTMYAGSDLYRHKNQLDQDLFELTDNLTIFSGDHTFTIGTHNEFFKFMNIFVKRAFGHYYFDSVDDFLNGEAYRVRQTYSLKDDPDAPAEFNVMQLGFYVGDEWQAAPNFKLTMGLRADIPIFPDTPDANPGTVAAFGVATDQTPSGNVMWSPRVGFNWDAMGNQKTQIRGGIGIFSGRTPYVWISNQYTNDGLSLTEVSKYGSIMFEPDPLNQPAYSGATPDLNMIDKDFMFPQVMRTNIAIDQELPGGFVGTVEFIYSKNMNEIKYQNLNLQVVGNHPGADPRALYGTIYNYNRFSTSWANSDFKNAIYLTNTDKGYQWSLSFQLQKQFDNGDFINLGYTYGMSKDINSGTSSQAISNWGYNIHTGDPNEPTLGYSNYDIRHRIVASFTKKVKFIPNAPTTFSLIYTGRSGNPFSVIYRYDYNGDGYANDSIYVPNDASEIILTNATWDEFNAYIMDRGLDKYRGEIVPRNALRDPWYHRVDLKIAQDIPLPIQGHKLQISIDFINILNFFNADWGVYKYIQFNENALQWYGYDSETGMPEFKFLGETGDDMYELNQLLSRWAAKFGLRYSF